MDALTFPVGHAMICVGQKHGEFRTLIDCHCVTVTSCQEGVVSMEERALVSVIIPIYNTEKYLHACVDSVIRQSYANLDIVLVDDGSTDGCPGICDAYAERDPRVQVFHKPNGGLASARNAGLRVARGEFIIWLDSDDSYEPRTVEKLYQALTAHGLKIAMCNYRNIALDGSVTPRYNVDFVEKVYSHEDMMALCLGGVFPATSSCSLMARELYEGIVYPEGRLFEDIATTWKLHERANGAVLLGEPMMNRVIRTEGISSNPSIRNRMEGCEAYINRYEEARERWPQYERAMLVSSARLLRKLRRKIINTNYREYRENAREIKQICAFYRRHRSKIIPAEASLRVRGEYRLLTSGTYAGFLASRAWVKLTSRHPPETYLYELKTPDMPPI